jgi:hypothetical protein
LQKVSPWKKSLAKAKAASAIYLMSFASLNPFKQIANTTIEEVKVFCLDALVVYDILIGYSSS